MLLYCTLQFKLCICMHMGLKNKNIRYIEKNASYLMFKVCFFSPGDDCVKKQNKTKHQDLIA